MAEHKTLAAALAAFQADLPHVGKDAVNPHFKSTYADLADVSKAVLPRLAAQGLAWITRPTQIDGQFVLAYELRHTSGESIEGTYPLGQGNHQQLGSAITYARRYCLSAVTGIAPDEDDDGNQAAQVRPAEPKRAVGDWPGKVAVCETVDAIRAVWAEAAEAGELTAVLPSGETVRDFLLAAKQMVEATGE